jgi:hypothetical protein
MSVYVIKSPASNERIWNYVDSLHVRNNIYMYKTKLGLGVISYVVEFTQDTSYETRFLLEFGHLVNKL